MFTIETNISLELCKIFGVFVCIPAIDKDAAITAFKESNELPFFVKNIGIDCKINILINNNAVLFDYFLIRIIKS